MSYQIEILGTYTTEQVLEYRYINVPIGDPAPTPATGYTVSLVVADLFGKDVYIEYKAYEQPQT